MGMAFVISKRTGQDRLTGRIALVRVPVLLDIAGQVSLRFFAHPAILIVDVVQLLQLRCQCGSGQEGHAHRQDKEQGESAFAQVVPNLHAINFPFLCGVSSDAKDPAADRA